MQIDLTENELIAIKIATREYLERQWDSEQRGPEYRPHPDSNIGATLAAYNKAFALQHGSSLATCEVNSVPEWLSHSVAKVI